MDSSLSGIQLGNIVEDVNRVTIVPEDAYWVVRRRCGRGSWIRLFGE